MTIFLFIVGCLAFTLTAGWGLSWLIVLLTVLSEGEFKGYPGAIVAMGPPWYISLSFLAILGKTKKIKKFLQFLEEKLFS